MFETVILVTRYYGGIQLGAGGLIRAYASAAKNCLNLLEKTPFTIMCDVEMDIPIEEVGSIYQLLQSFQVKNISETYISQPEDVAWSGVRLNMQVTANDIDKIEDKVVNATKGKVVFKTNS